MAETWMLVVLVAAVVLLLVTEWLPAEVTALLALGSVTILGWVTPQEAVAGFSNPAVVTIWSVFLLGGGLSRTGVAGRMGRHVLRLAGRQELRIVVVIMLSAGLLSTVISSVAVVALMLPVVMDIARSTGQPPSRLLLPLAYGTLLGGLTTLLGSSTNLLVSESLREHGLPPFRLFDFTPVGLLVMLVGVAFVAIAGRRLLPRRDPADAALVPPRPSLLAQYQLGERLFRLRLPAESALAGKALAETGISQVLDLQVVGIERGGSSELAPGPEAVVRAGDVLVARGRQERFQQLAGWRLLTDVPDEDALATLLGRRTTLAEVRVTGNAELAGKSAREIRFQQRFGASILGIRRAGLLLESRLGDEPLQAGDLLLVHGEKGTVDKLAGDPQFDGGEVADIGQLVAVYQLAGRMLVLRVPDGSVLQGQAWQAAGLESAPGLWVLAVVSPDGVARTPGNGLKLVAGDRLVVLGRRVELERVRALSGLALEPAGAGGAGALEDEQVGMVEAVLAPRSGLAGRRVREAGLRERLGVTLLALWRGGRPHRSLLREMELRHGDALLLYGPRARLQALGRDPDFIVLTEALQDMPRSRKAPVALGILGLVVLSVVAGWVPMYIAAVVGGALMVATGCLAMDEAYRHIEWKAVFLIAGLLPLGTAVANSGAASWLADVLASRGAGLGPVGMLAAVMGVTFALATVLHPAAVAVMLAPVVLQLAEDMGLSPRALMMGMAVAASSTFVSPLAHPANLLVMGPGGYRFGEYVMVGLPLTVVVWVVTIAVLPWVWPLEAF